MEKIRKHHISFTNALSGLVWALRTQPNFKVHLLFSLIAIILGLFLKISYLEMIVIIFTIVLGLSAEMINTAIEEITDLVTKEWREEAKIAKDVSAGMMLLTAVGAALVGLLIFLPKILDIIL